MISVGDDHGPYSCDRDDDDDDDGDGDDDLDDELIPRGLSGKLGRQRMRKLGKRGFAKMNNSKRSPFLYVKPGLKEHCPMPVGALLVQPVLFHAQNYWALRPVLPKAG
ncbi:hypothetical protein V6N12_036450 [Hibiscus sabdariffa]|uniref:Uncharacterized protein n=1 Tax=Hibiscus sabdariffa TaxID=183260 RepID=A0ABR2EQM3_9ROSI